jgi:EthD domain
MLKRFAFISKRTDISTEAFIDHYENHHVPLILSLAPTPLVYKRHYLAEPTDIDVVTELGWEDDAAFEAWMSRIREHGDIVAEDEARFIERDRMRSAVVEERVTAG